MNKKSAFSVLPKIIALLLTFSLFALISFEAFHTGHEEHCHEEDCSVCLILQIIHNTNKIGQSTSTVSAEFITFYYINILILSALLLAPATLVKQKVKLVI